MTTTDHHEATENAADVATPTPKRSRIPESNVWGKQPEESVFDSMRKATDSSPSLQKSVNVDAGVSQASGATPPEATGGDESPSFLTKTLRIAKAPKTFWDGLTGQNIPDHSEHFEFFQDDQKPHLGPNAFRSFVLVMAVLNTPIALILLVFALVNTVLVATAYTPDAYPVLMTATVLWTAATSYMWFLFSKGKTHPRLLPTWTRIRYVDPEDVPASIRDQRIHGTAGDLSSARGKFSDANIAAGEAGEKSTAKLMEAVAEIPGVRVFHGMHWPGSDSADIDHVIVHGTHMAVVDSKSWAGVHHKMAEDAQVVSTMDDGSEVERPIYIQNAARVLKERYPDMTVRAYLAVHSKPGTTFHMASGTPVSMASAEDTISEVTEFIKKPRNAHFVHMPLIRELQLLIDSPLAVKHTDIDADAEYYSPSRFRRKK
ncbi:nuclease-related domain-containing protein [Citricoccus zhacaiensis]